jgi:hypothetical protein
VTRDRLLSPDNRIVLPDSALGSGDLPLTLEQHGAGACYYAATLSLFSEEDPIRAVAGDIAVRRRYYRLVPGTAAGLPPATSVPEERPNPFLAGRWDLLDIGGERSRDDRSLIGARYERRPINPGDVLAPGDQIEVELDVESKNDYDHVLFEDIKPAGCEAVEVKSGEGYGLGAWSQMELRDERVALFVSCLPQGASQMRYRLWVEAPGVYSALPTAAVALYAPRIRALSGETKMTIR